MSEEAPENPPRNPLLFAVLNEVGIIAQLSRALMEARAPEGLNLPMFSVLNHLERIPEPATPLGLAQAFQQPKTSMTHTLMQLEKRGLIAMRPNPKDGRSKLVHLTASGRSARAQAIANLMEQYGGLSAEIDLARLADVLPALTELRQALDRNRP